MSYFIGSKLGNEMFRFQTATSIFSLRLSFQMSNLKDQIYFAVIQVNRAIEFIKYVDLKIGHTSDRCGTRRVYRVVSLLV